MMPDDHGGRRADNIFCPDHLPIHTTARNPPNYRHRGIIPLQASQGGLGAFWSPTSTVSRCGERRERRHQRRSIQTATRLPPSIRVSALLSPEIYPSSSQFLRSSIVAFLPGIATSTGTGRPRGFEISPSTPRSSRVSLPHSDADPSPRCVHSHRTALLIRSHFIRSLC